MLNIPNHYLPWATILASIRITFRSAEGIQAKIYRQITLSLVSGQTTLKGVDSLIVQVGWYKWKSVIVVELYSSSIFSQTLSLMSLHNSLILFTPFQPYFISSYSQFVMLTGKLNLLKHHILLIIVWSLVFSFESYFQEFQW